jgi:hypothetical protein
MWKAGQLPVPAEQLPTGTILVKAVAIPSRPSDFMPAFLLGSKERMWKPIYEVIGLVKRKICTRLLSGPGRLSRAPAKAFISTLDSLPGPFTIERGNEA